MKKILACKPKDAIPAPPRFPRPLSISTDPSIFTKTPPFCNSELKASAIRHARQVHVIKCGPRSSFTSVVKGPDSVYRNILITQTKLSTRHSKNTEGVFRAFVIKKDIRIPVVAKQIKYGEPSIREADLTQRADGLGDGLSKSVPFYGSFVKATPQSNKKHHFLILGLVEFGSLADYTSILSKKMAALSASDDPKWALNLIKQLLVYIHGLHQRGIVHNDLCDRNLFVGQGGTIVGADYGKSLDCLGEPGSAFHPKYFGPPRNPGPRRLNK
jgi:serine/threonine protein kinase